jgi:hypothetical protein
MSKQAFDNRIAKQTRRIKSSALQPLPPLLENESASSGIGDDEDAPAADEVPDQPADSSTGFQLPAAAAAGFENGVKVISCDAATNLQWRQAAGHQGRPSFDQVVDQGFDIILFDEAHLGSTSQLSKEAVQQLMAGPHTLLVLITATYVRPVGGYAVPPDRLLSWPLLDVGFARSGNLRELAERHGAEHLLAALRYCGMAHENQLGDSQLCSIPMMCQCCHQSGCLYYCLSAPECSSALAVCSSHVRSC